MAVCSIQIQIHRKKNITRRFEEFKEILFKVLLDLSEVASEQVQFQEFNAGSHGDP